jgi:hypothetical protein
MLVPLGIILIVLGSFVSLINWCTFFASSRRRYISPIPLIGATLLGCGMALLPETRPFAWLSLIVDYGTLAFLIVLPSIAWECWATSWINLLHFFKTNDSGRQIEIKLFRRGIAVISARFDPPAPCSDVGGHVLSFDMVGKWTATPGGYCITEYAADRELFLVLANGLYRTTELHYPIEKKYYYDCLNDLTFSSGTQT